MKHLRKIALWMLVLALIGALCAPAMARGRYLGELKVVNCRSYVTLREYASTSAPAVTTVPLGAWVEAYYYDSQFTECTYRGHHGYILSTYLSGGSGSAAASDPNYVGKRYIVNCNEFVTLRRYASTSAPAVTRVAKGEEVDAYYYNGTFFRCYYNGMEGYILSEYLGGSAPRGGSGSRGSSRSKGSYIGEMEVYNCEDWVSLRSQPSTSASRVAKVYWGETVSAWECPENRSFYYCEWNGYKGYILREYLR